MVLICTIRFNTTLHRARRVFGNGPFTVRTAAFQLGYVDVRKLAPHQVVSRNGRLYPALWAPPYERARQHAKSDIFRLYKMGLVSRSRCVTGRPGRRPFQYRVSPKGNRYLNWLGQSALIVGFIDLVKEQMGSEALPAAERLLGWLRAYEDDEVSGSVLGSLEILISWLRWDPSADKYADLWWWFAYAIESATENAPSETWRHIHQMLFPFLSHKIRPKRLDTGTSEDSNLNRSTVSDKDSPADRV